MPTPIPAAAKAKMLRDKQSFISTTEKYSTRKSAFKFGWIKGFQYSLQEKEERIKELEEANETLLKRIQELELRDGIIIIKES